MFGDSQASISSLLCCYMRTEVQIRQESFVYSPLPLSTSHPSISFSLRLYSIAATASIDTAMQRKNEVDVVPGP